MAKRNFFLVFWKAWESTFQPPLIKKAFEATGLSPPNPDVILDRFDPDSSEPIKDPNEKRTQHLNQALYHLYCYAEINEHATNKLEQALAIKNKRKKPGKIL
ncbi:hypothetical protein EJ02DRAFT_429209 [Clathrospora elynae]|uniref:Uncharacterized protein n=1 Tax=Clathrospora elynae TaxID=706981 RepID=A0A6A5S540_9PLEO|nr:hypothetical protein EJ02DRAFT_429209 [Clathrospora elynae]